MNHAFRNLRVFAISRGKDRLGPLDTGLLDLKVRVMDMDYNMHMNNAKFLESYELGRFDFVCRSGLLQYMLTNKVMPVVASTHAIYYKSLFYRQDYTVHTNLASWDDRWMYIEQEIHSKGRLIGTNICKGAFRGKGGVVNPSSIVADLGHPPETFEHKTQHPEYVKMLKQTEDEQKRVLKDAKNL